MVHSKAWKERELLRSKGQFWTPRWVADAMVAYALGGGALSLFDPAVGGGVFFEAARCISGRKIALRGSEVDPSVLDQLGQDSANVLLADFLDANIAQELPAIVANPPYIRHHRIPADRKERLRNQARAYTGVRIDGRAGLHVYFLIRALRLLAPGGRLAFILPADTFEGVFSKTLWSWVAAQFCIDAVVTFAEEASPFPGIDTNAVIIFIRRDAPRDSLLWGRVEQRNTDALLKWVNRGSAPMSSPQMTVLQRNAGEALQTGLSRPPQITSAEPSVPLGQFIRGMRGIATGANDYFWMTRTRAREIGLPRNLLYPCVGRTRDVPGDILAPHHLDSLEEAGRPTLLFCPDGRPADQYPLVVQKYLKLGEARGLPQRPLIATRTPWYKMEYRQPPPFLFAYLGRRNARFVRNIAGALPLTGFLCVYPQARYADAESALWQLLSSEEVLHGLSLVGKSYGGGALKVEPRALERTPVPLKLCRSLGLNTGVAQRTVFAET